MTWNLFLTAIVILLCIVFHRLSHKIGVPMLLGFILLGMMFGTDGIVKIYFENYRLAEQVCSVALIFIMFYGGFGTSWKEARPVAVKSILLSSLGVILTAVLTGAFCHLVLQIGLMESLLIGSVISSTDAASVFSILRSKKMGLKYHTASLLEVESGSNDPCSYMMTAIVLSIMSGEANANSISYMIFSQLVYGVGIAVILAYLTKKILRNYEFITAGFDMAFVIGIAILSYALPSLLGGNGYLSVYLVGLMLGNTKFKNKKSLVHFFDGVTGLMQMLIFFLLGLLATPSKIPEIFLTALAIALFLTLVARPCAVFVLLTPFRCSVKQQLLVSFAGLRGAASIVFAIMATVSSADTNMDLYHIVFCIVLLSILFQGTFLPAAAKILDMSDGEHDVLKTFSDYSEEVDLQFITLQLTDDFHPWLGQPIREITLPPDTIFVMILRNKEKLIPDGNTVFQLNDTAVLSARVYQAANSISLKEQHIQPDSRWVGTRIADFSPSSGELVLMIIRGDETIVPKGNTIILENDLLVIHSASQ